MDQLDALILFMFGGMAGVVGTLIVVIICTQRDERRRAAAAAKAQIAYAHRLYKERYEAFLLGHSLGEERAFAEDTKREIAHRIAHALHGQPD